MWMVLRLGLIKKYDIMRLQTVRHMACSQVVQLIHLQIIVKKV